MKKPNVAYVSNLGPSVRAEVPAGTQYSLVTRSLPMQQFGVYSEVGKLRKVIVHRPDLSSSG